MVERLAKEVLRLKELLGKKDGLSEEDFQRLHVHPLVKEIHQDNIRLSMEMYQLKRK